MLDLSKVGQPTEAMRDFATKIHIEVNDGLSWKQFEQILQDFDRCSKYISKYKKECIASWDRQRLSSMNSYQRRYGLYDSDFGLPFNSEDIDCFDLGIYPWGDS